MRIAVVQRIHKMLLRIAPHYWFSFGYCLGLILVLLIFHKSIDFKHFNSAVGLYAPLALIVLHGILNIKLFRSWIQSHQTNLILYSFLFTLWAFLPYILISIGYDNLFILSKLNPYQYEDFDQVLMKLDEMLFGVQPTMWLQSWVHPIFVEYFMLTYSMFIVIPFMYLVYLYEKGHIRLLYKVLFAEILSVAVALTSFIFLPAKGPRFYLANEYEVPLQGIPIPLLQYFGVNSLFELQWDMWNKLAQIHTDCFPSMHTCLCLIVLIFATKYRDLFKWKMLSMHVIWITVISLIISTVYLRYHWVVDVILGAIMAFFAVYLGEKVIDSWLIARERNKIPRTNLIWSQVVHKKPDKDKESFPLQSLKGGIKKA